jgi:hypothetical protein
VVATVLTRDKASVEEPLYQFLRSLRSGPDNDGDAVLRKKILSPLTHTAGDDVRGPFFRKPCGKKPRFVRWRLYLFMRGYAPCRVIYVYNSRRFGNGRNAGKECRPIQGNDNFIGAPSSISTGILGQEGRGSARSLDREPLRLSRASRMAAATVSVPPHIHDAVSLFFGKGQ